MNAIGSILVMEILATSCAKNINAPIPEDRREQSARIFHSIWRDLDTGRNPNSQPEETVLRRYKPTTVTILDGFTLFSFMIMEAGSIGLASQSNRLIRAQANTDLWRHDFVADASKTQLLAAAIEDHGRQRKEKRIRKLTRQDGSPYSSPAAGSESGDH